MNDWILGTNGWTTRSTSSDKRSVGDPTADTIGLPGHPLIWTFGRMQKRAGFEYKGTA